MERFFASLDGERGVLEIAGPERREFLQGLITNDVAKLTPDRALYAALLTAHGRYLHDFFLAEQGETFLLDGEAARARRWGAALGTAARDIPALAG